MFTKTEQKKLLKIKDILEEIWNGKLNKYHLTVTEANMIADAYNQIIKVNTAPTICKEVKQFFEKYGFGAKEDGIGWIITLK